MSAPARERIGRFRLRNIAHDAIRYTRTQDDHPNGPAVVDCPRCGTELRTRRPSPSRKRTGPGAPCTTCSTTTCSTTEPPPR